MNYRAIVEFFNRTAWNILPDTLRTIAGIIDERRQGIVVSSEEIERRIAESGTSNATRPQRRTVGTVAVLPLQGVIGHRMNAFEQSWVTSSEKFGMAFDSLVANPGVRAIVLDIDSPGGTAAGCEELAKKIFEARDKKPIVAVADALAASAAYYIGSAASELVVSPSALVGSIGTIAMHVDASEFYAQQGVKVSLVSAGKYKAEGNEYEPLSDEARAAMQKIVDGYYSAFVRDVARNRGVSVSDVKEGFGQGRVVGAKEAVSLGMADRVATMDQVLARYGVDRSIDNRQSQLRDRELRAMEMKLQNS